jgi:Mg/Co/Ni transporter MgtE
MKLKHMNKKLELISIISFIVLIVCMLIAISTDGPIEFDWMGKIFLGVLVSSMLGTVVPMIIDKSK